MIAIVGTGPLRMGQTRFNCMLDAPMHGSLLLLHAGYCGNIGVLMHCAVRTCYVTPLGAVAMPSSAIIHLDALERMQFTQGLRDARQWPPSCLVPHCCSLPGCLLPAVLRTTSSVTILMKLTIQRVLMLT
jgi:hypothetical protein